MIIPLGADRTLRRPTVINRALVLLNVAVYLVTATALASQSHPDAAPAAAPGFADPYLLHPADPRWWQFVTYAFLHAGPVHLLGNMVFLWTFGANVEDRFGRAGYALFYLGGCAAAGAAHVLTADAPVLGASGGVAAVTGAYLVLFPRTLIRCFVLFFIIGVVQIPAVWFIAASIIWDFARNAGGGTGVAWMAHLGGYVYGAAIPAGLLLTGALKREEYDLVAMIRHTDRRRRFRAIAGSGSSGWTHDDAAVRVAKKHRGRAAAAATEPDPAALALRAEVAKALGDNRPGDAAAAYRRLLDNHGEQSFPRDQQIDLANRLFAADMHALAGKAYDGFLARFADDPEAPRVRLMLGLIHARYLNDPLRAKSLLREARDGVRSPDQRSLANELLTELG